MKKARLAIIVMVLAVAILACASPNTMVGTPHPETGKIYGFWNGVWDGGTMTTSFILSLFGVDYGIYEIYNNGAWYNFGYVLGLGGTISIVAAILRVAAALIFGE